MRTWTSNLVGACLAMVLLAACGGVDFSSSMPMPAASPLFTPSLAAPLAGWPSSLRLHQVSGRSPSPLFTPYGVLYRFGGGGGNDGVYPEAGLVKVGASLYGTTSAGGLHGSPGGYGTVFKITTSGAETVLYNFRGGKDGLFPRAGLIDVGGTLYGTTYYGGVHNNGTVFKITTSGAETVLYRFKGGNDGAEPDAGLVNVSGTLYGTTSGGLSGSGTVFKITTSGTETVLYRFCQLTSCDDGANPEAGLVSVGGTLYGTTINGGVYHSSNSIGKGTVFKITTSGTETVLHSFGVGFDGAVPQAALMNVGRTLYGTTEYGGVYVGSPSGRGYGTVFKITTGGNYYAAFYSFKGGTDGANPLASLINCAVGALCGTTYAGGTNNDGTAFFIRTSGSETLLHSFTGQADGANPYAGLVNAGGTLYGTTAGGAPNSCCFGTVFYLRLEAARGKSESSRK